MITPLFVLIEIVGFKNEVVKERRGQKCKKPLQEGPLVV
jgi:hypothetical protein